MFDWIRGDLGDIFPLEQSVGALMKIYQTNVGEKLEV